MFDLLDDMMQLLNTQTSLAGRKVLLAVLVIFGVPGGGGVCVWDEDDADEHVATQTEAIGVVHVRRSTQSAYE